MAVETFIARLTGRHRLTDNVDQLNFDRVDKQPFEFVPGQFVTLLLPEAAGTIKRRSYSIATDIFEGTSAVIHPNLSGTPVSPGCSPGRAHVDQPRWIEVAVSYVADGFASTLLRDAALGDEFQMMGPVGRLILQKEPGRRLILVGTGTGIAPYRAMLRQLSVYLETDPSLEVMILQGVSHRSDVLYGEAFEAFAKHQARATYVSCLSRERSAHSPYEHVGRVQTYLQKLALKPGSDVVYLCGNPHMIDETFAWLTGLGFPTKDVRREKYISS